MSFEKTDSQKHSYQAWDEDSVYPSLKAPFFEEHLARYYFATSFARGRNVIDLGCGKGYGSYALAHAADHVTGVDLNPDSLSFARAYYSRDNCTFTSLPVHNLTQFEQWRKKFDLVTCFEVIEHLEPKNANELLSEIATLMTSTGCALISTPNLDLIRKSRMPIPDFHINCLGLKDFVSALQNHFQDVQILGQYRRTNRIQDALYMGDRFMLRHAHAIQTIRSLMKDRLGMGRRSKSFTALANTSNQKEMKAWQFSDGWAESERYLFSPSLRWQAATLVAVVRSPT